MSDKNVLQAWDYVIFASMLLVSTITGIYFAYKNKKAKGLTTEECLIGSRQISAFPIALSLAASFLSAITAEDGKRRSRELAVRSNPAGMRDSMESKMGGSTGDQ
ncbi:sodium-coupled monocarboxylate transporter 2-like [Hypanus sabinus]|uniref:sodium-coupled monocarboxylate transporter 2-like n=1 Tax=Hypanus sabinus TaxID=79690 RepID=UPI0028C478B7|nr:sodium-coupled monocarboxylate transporter 2-like [Hypanus sabinus]